MDARTLIVTRAARFFHDGDLVNLGIGMPTLVANLSAGGRQHHAPVGKRLHGLGPTARGLGPRHGKRRRPAGDPSCPGASVSTAPLSFGLIRGGHVDATVLGALEVDQRATWPTG